MPVNLRYQVEEDLSFTLEGEWGLPVILIDPDGNEISTKNGTNEPLTGQILYDTTTYSIDTGLPKVVNHPVVTLRRSSLPRVPKPGEKWLVRIPIKPIEGAAIENFIFDPTRPPEGGGSIGFIRLYLRKAVQS